MAFNVQRIHPLDLQPRKAVGVSIPFSNRSVFNLTYTTQEALKSNLINFCLTDKNERFLNPDFGAGIRALLFENAVQDKVEEIDIILRSGIATWFSDVIILDLQVAITPDSNTVTVYIKYTVSQTNIQDQVVINFQQ